MGFVEDKTTSSMLTNMDLVAKQFREVYNKNGKAIEKEGEVERAVGVLTDILRICEPMNKLPEAQSHIGYNEVLNHLLANKKVLGASNKDIPRMKEIYDQIAAENGSSVQ